MTKNVKQKKIIFLILFLISSTQIAAVTVMSSPMQNYKSDVTSQAAN